LTSKRQAPEELIW